MTPSPPVLPKRFGERAAVTETFFTLVLAQASVREFFSTGTSIMAAQARQTKQGTWSSITMGHFADAGRKDASKLWLPALPLQKKFARGSRRKPVASQ